MILVQVVTVFGLVGLIKGNVGDSNGRVSSPNLNYPHTPGCNYAPNHGYANLHQNQRPLSMNDAVLGNGRFRPKPRSPLICRQHFIHHLRG